MKPGLISKLYQEAVESSGAVPVRGLESLLASTASSSVLQAAVEEVTSDTIQVTHILKIILVPVVFKVIPISLGE